MRTTLSRMGTASVGHQAAYLPYHDIKVQQNRPVTVGGLVGIDTSQSNTGREVHDATYYIGLLRTKNEEISQEYSRLESELKEFEQNSSSMHQLKCHFEEKLKKVQELEGILADYNLALDKHRSRKDPASIDEIRERLEIQNTKKAAEIDKIFLNKQKKEKLIKDFIQKLESIQNAEQERIRRLDPDQLDNYKNSLQYLQELEAEGRTRQSEIHQLQQEIEDLDLDEAYRKESTRQKRLRRLVDQYEYDLEVSRLAPKTAHVHLLNKVKADKARTNELNESLLLIERNVEELTGTKNALESELTEGSVLFNRYNFAEMLNDEQTIRSELQSLDEELIEVRNNNICIRRTIEALSENPRENATKSDELLESAEEAKCIDDFTPEQRESEKLQALVEERKKRVVELEKLNSLEEKIIAEIAQLEEKNRNLLQDQGKYEDIDRLMDRAKFTKHQLREFSTKYSERREEARQKSAGLSKVLKEIRDELSDSDTAKKLKMLQERMRNNEQEVSGLKDVVAAKKICVDYGTIQEQCAEIVEELNAHLTKKNVREDF